MRALSILVPFLMMASPGWAQLQSTYSFGGACPSQGNWTQAVLRQSDALATVIDKLANDEECNSMRTALQKYYASIQANPDMNGNQGQSNLGELTGQLFSLAGVLKSAPIEQSVLANALAQKTVEVQGAQAPLKDPNANANLPAPSLRQRSFRAMDSGLGILNSLTDVMSQDKTCLTKEGAPVGQLVSGIVYTISAYAAGGDNAAGARIAQAISSISSFLQNGNYNRALKNLDQENFDNSVRCLMEVTTDSYCSIKDNLEMLSMSVKSLKLQMAQQQVKGGDAQPVAPDTSTPKTPVEVRRIVTNPFSGLYILSRHVANMNTFFQKILMGKDPSDKYESQRYTDIEDDRSTFFKSAKDLTATYNQGRTNVLQADTLRTQRNTLATLLADLVDKMTANAEGDEGSGKNFFQIVGGPNELPFILIGLKKEEYPCRVYNLSLCQGAEKAGGKVRFRDWVQWGASDGVGEWSFMNDPKAALDTVNVNLTRIISEAGAAFNTYYGTWFLPDKTLIIEQAFIGRPSVYDSLYATTKYLEDFEQRAAKLGYERAPIKASRDTRRRINTALRTLYDYKKASDIGDDLETLMSQSDLAMLDLYRLFNLQLSRTTFLTERLQKIVTADYQMMLDSGVDFSDYQKKLLYALGESVTTDTANMLGKNWQTLESDLKNASGLAMRNLENVEDVFADQLLASIAKTRMIARNMRPTSNTVNFDSVGRLVNNSIWDFLKANPHDDILITATKKALTAIDPNTYAWAIYNSFWHGDRYRYNWPSLRKQSSSLDSTFGAAAYVTAQMCIQSLAFNNLEPFQDFCKGSILPSVFSDSLTTPLMNAKDIDALNASYDKIMVMNSSNPSQNHEDRICAFRNYYRNNYIFQLSIGMQAGSSQGTLVVPPTDLVLKSGPLPEKTSDLAAPPKDPDAE